MKLRKICTAALVSIAAIIQAGCSFGSSPAEGLNFQAPPGWQSSPGIMGFMQFWRSPTNDQEILMLFRSPKPLPEGAIFSNSQMQETLKDVVVTRRSRIEICGNQPATYIEARGSSSKGGDENIEMVMTTARGTSYFAMYVWPIAFPANAQAAAALRELCLKS
jgi:hypothetical protein